MQTQIPELWTKDDQSQQAMYEARTDALLRGCRGVYTEVALARKVREHETNIDDNGQCVQEDNLPEFVLADLHDSAQQDLMYFGRRCLSDEDADAWNLYAIGCTQIEIAEALKIDQSVVSRRLNRARILVGYAFLESPWFGWLRVYWDEVHRG